MGGQALVDGGEEEVEDLKQDIWAKPMPAIEAPLPIEAPPTDPPPEPGAGAVQAFGVDITKDEASGEAKWVQKWPKTVLKTLASLTTVYSTTAWTTSIPGFFLVVERPKKFRLHGIEICTCIYSPNWALQRIVGN